MNRTDQPRKRRQIIHIIKHTFHSLLKKIALHREMKHYEWETGLLRNDLFRFVIPAHFAYVVSKFQFSTLLAFHHTWHRQFKVRTTFVAASFGSSSLWYCHVSHLLHRITAA